MYGNRIEKSYDADGAGGGGATVTRFAYDMWKNANQYLVGNENNDVWADLNGSSSLTTRYLRGDIIDQVFSRRDSGTTYWSLTDRLGSVRDVIDNSAVVKDTIAYDGFGGITSETDSSFRGRYAWTGREIDTEINLQYNRARYYDANAGRWISQDPLGFDAGDSNLYRYVANSPTQFSDPSGTENHGLSLADQTILATFLVPLNNVSKDDYLSLLLSTQFSDGKILLNQVKDIILQNILTQIVNGAFNNGADAITLPPLVNPTTGVWVYWKDGLPPALGAKPIQPKDIPILALIGHELQHAVQIKEFINKQTNIEKRLWPGLNFLKAYLAENDQNLAAKMKEADAYRFISFEMQGHAVQNALEKLLSDAAMLKKFNDLMTLVGASNLQDGFGHSIAKKGLGKELFLEFKKLYEAQLQQLEAQKRKLLGR